MARPVCIRTPWAPRGSGRAFAAESTDPRMEELNESRKPSGLWVASILGTILVMLASGGCWWTLQGLGPKSVVVYVGTNGVLRVVGVPLQNKAVRKAALSLVARSKAAVHLQWQSPGGKQGMGKPMTRGGATTAQLETLHAMAKAGITNLTSFTEKSTHTSLQKRKGVTH